ncbi:mismatch-specific DNA-glycosylase [Flindersiella endophytica]
MTEPADPRELTIPDVIAPGLDILFCGINPGLMSAATGHHFARPGNRFWPALHKAGLTPRLLRPDEQDELPAYGIGITNLVARASAKAAELGKDELRAGGMQLGKLVRRYRPAWVAVVGVTAFRTAFEMPNAKVGPLPDTPEPLRPAKVWLLPNPSGLNAHYTLATLAEEFARLRAVARR